MLDLQSMTLFLILPLLICLAVLRRSRNSAKLPPGPHGIPFLGNLFQMPTSSPWLTFKEWHKTFGPLVHINIAGQHIVILGDAKTAGDLLDRRSAIYSDRPRFIVSDILSGGLVLPFMQYESPWKRMWKGFYEVLNKNSAKKYYPYQDAESALLIAQLLAFPTEFIDHLKRQSSSFILSMLYGHPPLSSSTNPTIQKVSGFARQLAKSAAPGEYYVEIFPWMRFLPRWMCKWRRDVEGWHADIREFANNLVQGVENDMNQGTQKSCFTSALLEEKQHQFTMHEITWMSLTLYAGGSETTATIMSWFILAMVINPSVQQKAHEEIDKVVGRERLPTFNDIDKLPYIKAIVKETLRWCPAGPLGIPHRLREDDWYNGYFIPKDTICIANQWVISRDPSIYGPDTDDFNPGRYIEGENLSLIDGKEDNHFLYGFGRRTCVGRHIANNSLFLQIARILWAFELTPVMNDAGESVLPDPNKYVENGITVCPEDFKCNFSPRFEGVEKIVDDTIEALGLTELFRV